MYSESLGGFSILEIMLMWIGSLVLVVSIAFYAESKGKSFWLLFFVGLILSPLVSLIVALLMPADEKEALSSGEVKKCPYCAELVKVGAVECKHCGKTLPEMTKPRGEGFLGEHPLKLAIAAGDIDRVKSILSAGFLFTDYQHLMDPIEYAYLYSRDEIKVMLEEYKKESNQ